MCACVCVHEHTCAYENHFLHHFNSHLRLAVYNKMSFIIALCSHYGMVVCRARLRPTGVLLAAVIHMSLKYVCGDG